MTNLLQIIKNLKKSLLNSQHLDNHARFLSAFDKRSDSEISADKRILAEREPLKFKIEQVSKAKWANEIIKIEIGNRADQETAMFAKAVYNRLITVFLPDPKDHENLIFSEKQAIIWVRKLTIARRLLAQIDLVEQAEILIQDQAPVSKEDSRSEKLSFFFKETDPLIDDPAHFSELTPVTQGCVSLSGLE